MDIDHAVSNIQIEVNGIATSTFNYGADGSPPEQWTYVSTLTYDAKELRIPSQESNAIFLASWISPHLPQSRSPQTFCGDPTKYCTSDSDCRQKHKSFFGEDTYVCLDFFCLIRGWCPIQYPSSIRRMSEHMSQWKLFIKAVTFPVFRTSRKNFNAKQRKISFVNTFTIEDILKEVGTDSYADIQDTGIIIHITVDFQCMYHLSDCQPIFSFERIDNGYGFSFLYSMQRPALLIGQHLLPETRVTQELKGVRILFSIQGGMYKFNFFALLLSIGSFVGLLKTAHAITDFILLNIHEEREEVFLLHKYRFLDDDRMIERVNKQIKKHLTYLGYY